MTFNLFNRFQVVEPPAWRLGRSHHGASQATAHFMSSAIQSQPNISGSAASTIHQISTVICRLTQRLQTVLQSRR